jgi:putative peptide zinc metalloprotease protein
LSQRSQAWWHARWHRAFTGQAAPQPQPAPGEAPWLVLYSPVSWLYRAALSVWIVGWLGSVQAWLGEAAGALFAWQLLVAPLLAARTRLQESSLDLAARRRARRLGVAAGGTMLCGAVLVALPDVSSARGVVWLPEDAWVRASTEGEFVRLLAVPGEEVRRGQDIAELVDEQVVAEQEAARERVQALTTQLYAELTGGHAQSRALVAQIEAAQASMAALQTRVQGLRVKSPAGGRFSVDRPDDLPGRWLQRGATIGYVLPPVLTTVRIALPGEDARAVARHLRRIELRTWDEPGRVVLAKPDITVPAATRRLHAKALGTSYGGDIVVDPADKDETATREPIVVLDLEAQEPLGLRIGTRVSVRLVRGDAPLAVQLARRVRQLTLGHFNAEE